MRDHDWKPAYRYGGAFGWDMNRMIEHCAVCGAAREVAIPMWSHPEVRFVAGVAGDIIDNNFKEVPAECPGVRPVR